LSRSTPPASASRSARSSLLPREAYSVCAHGERGRDRREMEEGGGEGRTLRGTLPTASAHMHTPALGAAETAASKARRENVQKMLEERQSEKESGVQRLAWRVPPHPFSWPRRDSGEKHAEIVNIGRLPPSSSLITLPCYRAPSPPLRPVCLSPARWMCLIAASPGCYPRAARHSPRRPRPRRKYMRPKKATAKVCPASASPGPASLSCLAGPREAERPRAPRPTGHVAAAQRRRPRVAPARPTARPRVVLVSRTVQLPAAGHRWREPGDSRAGRTHRYAGQWSRRVGRRGRWIGQQAGVASVDVSSRRCSGTTT